MNGGHAKDHLAGVDLLDLDAVELAHTREPLGYDRRRA